MPRILAYGDSNTFGTAATPTLGESAVLPKGARWPDQMARELGSGYEVIVEGLPGRSTVFDDPIEGSHLNGLTVLPAVLLSHQPIDVLIIALGTNDQKVRFALDGLDVALGVARLVKDALALGVVGKVLAVCPPPVIEAGELAEMFRAAPQRCADLPALMERSVVREGASFFDAGRHIEVDPIDGVHWTASAHAVLGLELADLLRAME